MKALKLSLGLVRGAMLFPGMLEIEPRAMTMLGNHSTTEPYPLPLWICLCFCVLETESCYKAQASFGLRILVPEPLF